MGEDGDEDEDHDEEERAEEEEGDDYEEDGDEEEENRMLDKLLQAAAEVCEWIRQTGDWFGHLLLLKLPPTPPD